VAPKPVNFLMATATDFSVDDLAAMGVRRISTGGSLARVAWTAFVRSAREIAQHGTFKSFDGTMTNAELNAFFRDDVKSRS
jgi:2-methylisocitrate lyase-like PEP mutase family enzyme